MNTTPLRSRIMKHQYHGTLLSARSSLARQQATAYP